ncbi:MAG: hypothetical protein GY896_22190 [Gammaproteobacteria bacterium]|nr:hypothetical protein [Gammaproteobacteria bacterium]MCP4980178.1 hypothetical protein [Gammaproteobacteria bacterium]
MNGVNNEYRAFLLAYILRHVSFILDFVDKCLSCAELFSKSDEWNFLKQRISLATDNLEKIDLIAFGVEGYYATDLGRKWLNAKNLLD